MGELAVHAEVTPPLGRASGAGGLHWPAPRRSGPRPGGRATPTGLSIYLSKKRAPCLSAYLSISPKNGRLTFFASPPHAFVGFLKDEKWHAGPDFTPVSGKNSREMALRWPRLGFSSHFLQPIYLSLQKTSASPLSLSIYLSKYRAPLKFQLYLRKKNAILDCVSPPYD